jgi:hypothetical protein
MELLLPQSRQVAKLHALQEMTRGLSEFRSTSAGGFLGGPMRGDEERYA